MLEPALNAQQEEPLYRIGAVSQLTGIAVATLRVWQSRYGVVMPVKNAGGQRLYSDQEVNKLKMLKALCHLGHSIGTLSKMSLDQLHELLLAQKFQPPTVSSVFRAQGPRKILCLGLGMEAKLESIKFELGLQLKSLHWAGAFSDLQEAIDDPHGLWAAHSPEVLLIKLDTLQTQAVQRIEELQSRYPSVSMGVLYSYAQPNSLQALQASGVQVKREPLSNEELCDWILGLFNATPAETLLTEPVFEIQSKKFDPQTLAYLMTLSTSIKCECPKHLAELIAQINAFSQFSEDCLNQNQEDQKLHAHLFQVSQTCRTLFEDALEKILDHEKIVLPDSAAPSLRLGATTMGKIAD